MKRLTSILFIFILLLNLYGYRLMINYMDERQDLSMQTRLDQQDYKESELISIKTQLDLPYYNSATSGFERAYGSVSVNGIEYQFVMRRVFLDSMELLCLPNTSKLGIESARQELNKISFSDQPSQNNKKQGTIKISLPDFCQDVTTFIPSLPAKSRRIQTPYIIEHLPTQYIDSPEQPPESLSA